MNTSENQKTNQEHDFIPKKSETYDSVIEEFKMIKHMCEKQDQRDTGMSFWCND